MGSIVKSVATRLPDREGSLVALLGEVAADSVRAVDLDFRDVGILINASVYNETHLREPSLASLVQDQISRELGEGERTNPESRTFAFDLHGGGGGAMNAIQVLDTSLCAGRTAHAMLVAGDMRPHFGTVENYRYRSSAAALILARGEKEEGFVAFRTDTYAAFADDHRSTISWGDEGFLFRIREEPDYLRHCTACAEESVNNFLRQTGLRAQEIDLVLCSMNPAGFAEAMESRLEPALHVHAMDAMDIYSAGILFALDDAITRGPFRSAHTILLLGVGAGLTVTTALYRRR